MAHAYEDVYKIGTAGDPARRVRAFTLPTGPIRLVHTIRSTRAYWLEKQLHRCFRGKRMHGEWFRLTEDEVARFCSLAECNRPEQLPEWCPPTRKRIKPGTLSTKARFLPDNASSPPASLPQVGPKTGKRPGRRLFYIEIDQDLADEFTALAQRNGHPISTAFAVAMKGYLAMHWPELPPAPPDPPPDPPPRRRRGRPRKKPQGGRADE